MNSRIYKYILRYFLCEYFNDKLDKHNIKLNMNQLLCYYYIKTSIKLMSNNFINGYERKRIFLDYYTKNITYYFIIRQKYCKITIWLNDQPISYATTIKIIYKNIYFLEHLNRFILKELTT